MGCPRASALSVRLCAFCVFPCVSQGVVLVAIRRAPGARAYTLQGQTRTGKHRRHRNAQTMTVRGDIGRAWDRTWGGTGRV